MKIRANCRVGFCLAFYFPVTRWGSLVEVTSCPDLDFVSANRKDSTGVSVQFLKR